MYFCGVTPKATFTGTSTHQGKMVEKRVQRREYREEACCVQLRFPIIPPSQLSHLFIVAQVPRTNTELRPGLYLWLIPTQYRSFDGSMSALSQAPNFCIPLDLFTHWVSQFLCSRIPQGFLRHLQVQDLRTCFPPGSFPDGSSAWPLPPEKPAHSLGLPTGDSCCPPTDPPRIIVLDLPSLSPTLSRYPANFSDFLWMNISPKWTSEGRDIEIHPWDHSQHHFGPVGRSGVLSSMTGVLIKRRKSDSGTDMHRGKMM